MTAPLSIVVPMPRLELARLGPTLGSLSEGVFDALVREVLLVSPHDDERLRDIVQATGAQLIKAEGGPALLQTAGVRAARGDWCLSLPVGAVLPAGWTVSVRDHLRRSPGQKAAFRLSGTAGFRATFSTRLLGAPLKSQVVLEPRRGSKGWPALLSPALASA